MREDMTQNQQNPFTLVNAFFITLHFERGSTLPDALEMPLEIQIKVVDKDFPRFQINLRNKTQDQSPLKLDLELVGLFEYIGDNPEQGRGLINDFIREKGLNMLWPYVSQMTRMITSQMGMNPLNIRTPIFSNLTPAIETGKVRTNE